MGINLDVIGTLFITSESLVVIDELYRELSVDLKPSADEVINYKSISSDFVRYCSNKNKSLLQALIRFKSHPNRMKIR